MGESSKITALDAETSLSRFPKRIEWLNDGSIVLLLRVEISGREGDFFG
jgi:hypothetical protein